MDGPISFRAGWAMLGGEGYSMKTAISAWVAIFAFCAPVPAIGQTDMLPAPGFHHLHLNSVDPDAAIDFYTRHFPSTARTSFAGLPALTSPNNVLLLFSKVAAQPATGPQTAIWHFGWHVTDVRRNRDAYQARPDATLLPLYTGDAGGSVLISTDTWPGRDGVLGLTKAQITEAKQTGVAHRGRLPSRTQPRADLAGARNRGADPRADRRRRVRRRGLPVLYAPGRHAARTDARPALRPRRARRRRSRRLGRQAAARGRHFPGAALPAGRHPRRHDRGPEPRGDRAGGDEIARIAGRSA